MSKEKRELQKKARERAKRREKNRKFLLIAGTALAIILLVGGTSGYYYYNNVYLTKPVENYSQGLSDDGLIKDVKATDYVKLCDYNNISVSKESLSATEADWESYIGYYLNQYGEMSDAPGQVVARGDVINMDYVGTIDGVAFEGGSTEGMGTTISVGTAGYIDGFEDQLVGHRTGETFDIDVVFPEDYGVDELNGKPAVFTITINSKNAPSEYNDEFVANYLCEDYEILTAEEYKKQYMESAYNNNYIDFVQSFVVDNSTVLEYPEKYLDLVKGTIKYVDINNFNGYNDYYVQATGSKMYKKFSDYTGMDTKEYEANLSAKGQETVKEQLIVQAIFEDAGLTITDENIDAALGEFGVERQYYSNFAMKYGEGYMKQLAMRHAVFDYLDSKILITE